MSRNYNNARLLLGALLLTACGARHVRETPPEDPIAAMPPAPLPVGSLAGESTLLLTTGTVVFGDSTHALFERRTALIAAANAALDTALRRDAREVTWQGLAEQRRVIRRNPAINVDPDRLPTSYLINATEQVPEPLWSDIRMLAALTQARFAVVPVAVRIGGTMAAPVATWALVAVDARTGRVVWRGRTEGRPAATPESALASAAAALVPGPVP